MKQDALNDSRKEVTDELYEKVKKGLVRPEDLSLYQILVMNQRAEQELREKTALYEETERRIVEEELEMHSPK